MSKLGIWASSASAAPPVLTFVAATPAASGGSTYTFTAAAIGTAAADRLVVVAISARNTVSARTVNSVTIGGNSATVDATTNASTMYVVTFAYLVVPSGTTATIVVNFSGATSGAQIAVYTITGLSSTTPVASNTSGFGVTPASTTCSATANGVLIATSVDNGGANVAWTGPTEDSDNSVTGSIRASSASKSNTGASENVQADDTGTIINVAAISWR